MLHFENTHGMGVRRNFKFSRGATSTYCLSFSGCWRWKANDVYKRFTLSTPQRKGPMLRQQWQKMRFVDSNSQIYYDNFKQGAPFRYCRPILCLFLWITAVIDFKTCFVFCIACVLLPHTELSLLPHVSLTVFLLTFLIQKTKCFY